MDRHSYKYTKYTIAGYIFKDSIERVYEVFRTPDLLDKVQKQLQVHSEKLRNPDDKFDDVGAIFSFVCQYGLTSVFVIEDSTNTDNYKMFQLFAFKVTPDDFQYRLRFSFYKCNLLNQTVYVEEMWYYYNTLPSFSIDQKSFLKNIELKGKLVECFLKSYAFNLKQAEGVTIKVDIDTMWNVITDWNKFKSLVPRIADEIEFNGRPCEIGSEMTIVSKKAKYKLKVVKCEGKTSQRSYHLISFCGHPQLPVQELQFTLVHISECESYLCFVHEFKDPVRYTALLKIGKEKKEILKELRIALENLK